MSARFFLDTNLFVYTFVPNAPEKTRRANDLIRHALASHRGVISFQVVQEFFSVAFKRLTPRMTTPEADGYFAKVLRPLVAPHSSPALYAEALRLHGTFRLSWYDALIVVAALQTNCEILYSEDLQHGQVFGNLRIVNPFL